MGAEGGDSGESKPSCEPVGSVSINIRCSNGGTKFVARTSLESTVGVFKGLLAENCDVPAAQQRLIYKGRILKDDQTLESYGLQADHTVHMVRGFSPASSNPPAPAVDTGSGNTTAGATRGTGANDGTPLGGLGSPLFAGLDFNSLGGGGDGGGASNLFGAGFPEFEQVQQQLTQNPNMMREIMNMPAIQNLMNNPEMMRTLIMSNPQMRDIVDRNPELAHILNDPGILWQTVEAAQNPELMRGMMRNTDRAMINIEASPEGFNMLRRMYENVQEPFLNATTMGGNNNSDLSSNPLAALLGNQGVTQARAASNNPSTTASETPAVPNTNPLPNPWNNASEITFEDEIDAMMREAFGKGDEGKDAAEAMPVQVATTQDHITSPTAHAEPDQSESEPYPREVESDLESPFCKAVQIAALVLEASSPMIETPVALDATEVQPSHPPIVITSSSTPTAPTTDSNPPLPLSEMTSEATPAPISTPSTSRERPEIGLRRSLSGSFAGSYMFSSSPAPILPHSNVARGSFRTPSTSQLIALAARIKDILGARTDIKRFMTRFMDLRTWRLISELRCRGEVPRDILMRLQVLSDCWQRVDPFCGQEFRAGFPDELSTQLAPPRGPTLNQKEECQRQVTLAEEKVRLLREQLTEAEQEVVSAREKLQAFEQEEQQVQHAKHLSSLYDLSLYTQCVSVFALESLLDWCDKSLGEIQIVHPSNE